MQELKVELEERSYPIYIGTSIIGDKKLIKKHVKGSQVLIVTNETVAPLYLDQVAKSCSGLSVSRLILPDGEIYKNLTTVNLIFDKLLKEKHNRSTTLIALGGGVIGDITGFSAACYQRGVKFIQIPTTLLSQVDSSVGGKTGVNHSMGKNMIGAFYQPQCVIADTSVLNTLPERQLRSGFAEVIKYGIICDKPFFEWLENHYQEALNLDSEKLEYIISRSCQNKADIVSQDEKESGLRAILNLGHTFGHAIETFQQYKDWLHGEAIAAGMVMAADLSTRLGWLPVADAQKIRNLIQASGLPVTPPSKISPEQFIELMLVDKKVINGSLRLVLLKALGNAIITNEFDQKTLSQTLKAGKNLCSR